ncbi:MAG: hypothetical protein ACFFCS_29220, partial [Candidatus Hodarchaeota archaeon]
IIEADLSPTLTGSISSWKTKEEILENLEILRAHVVSLVKLHDDLFPALTLVQKITGQNRDIFPWIIEELKKSIPDDRSFNFTTFNRQFATLALPWVPARIKSAVGGPAVFYHNLHVLDKLMANKENERRIKVSYTGGVDDGIKALWVLGLTNATSIQVATALMRQGGFNALARILGGFSLSFSWLCVKLEKDFGLDVSSIKKLNLLFNREEIEGITEGYLERSPRPRFAIVDPENCNANCQVSNLITSPVECPASITCPAYAFDLKENRSNQHIVPEICIGCGNCGENCARNAISFKII